MNRLSFYRIALLLAGMPALLVIVLSQPIKVRQPAEKDQVCISAPSDFLSGSSVEAIPETVGFSVEWIKECGVANIEITSPISGFFQTLFRTLIVSQAP